MTKLFYYERVKGLRLRFEMSVGELAEKTGLSKTTIYEIERGRLQPRVRTIQKLAEALDVEPECFTERGLPVIKGEFIGRRLRELRGFRLLLQREVATRAGIERETIQRLENGVTKNPTLETVRQLAQALEVPTSFFYDEQPDWGKLKVWD